MMILILGLVIVIGLMLLKDRKAQAQQVPPPVGSGSTMFNNEESAIGFISGELARMGASNSEIDEYIEWLQDKPRTDAEIQKKIASIT